MAAAAGLCLHSAETNDAQSLASGLPVRCPAASATPHLWPACAVLCLSPELRCPLCLSPLPASHSVERSAPGLQNLMLRHILTVITLGTAHGFGPLLSVEATDMNTC